MSALCDMRFAWGTFSVSVFSAALVYVTFGEACAQQERPCPVVRAFSLSQDDGQEGRCMWCIWRFSALDII